VVEAVKGANLGERAAKLRLPEMRRQGATGTAGGPRAEAPTATMAASAEDARLERLERLGELRAKGVLSEEEFAAEKARLLGREDGAERP
jgi:Short C-terminal domain